MTRDVQAPGCDQVCGPARLSWRSGSAAALLGRHRKRVQLVAVEVAKVAGVEIAETVPRCALVGTAEFPLSIAATACAFLLQQAAFARGRVSLVVPLIAGGGTLVVLVLGAVLLREGLDPPRLAGVLAMGAGTLLLSLRARGGV